jgi:hypothetical protein
MSLGATSGERSRLNSGEINLIQRHGNNIVGCMLLRAYFTSLLGSCQKGRILLELYLASSSDRGIGGT